MKRRLFIKELGLLTTAFCLTPDEASAALFGKSRKKQFKGFNLLNKFNPDFQSPFNEKDFEIMSEWGFNFARILPVLRLHRRHLCGQPPAPQEGVFRAGKPLSGKDP